MAEEKTAADVWGFYTVDIFDCPPFQMFTIGDDPRSHEIIRLREFEPHSMKIWCHLARTASCILDIGAHSGIYALAAASLRKEVSVFAFEPQPYTAARLRLHRQLNRFENLADQAVALSNVDGVAKVAWPDKQGELLPSSARLGHSAKYHAPVYTRRLDTFDIAYGESALVKIDVEGFELNVLMGATNLLKARPTVIIETFNEEAAKTITGLLPGYRFARIIEAGGMQWISRLFVGDGVNGNQLCIPAERAADLPLEA